jgi:carbonic anhydrase
MQKLVDGIHKFQRNYFSQDQKLFETLVDGQHPLALFITCSDSRINPNYMTQTKPGELFIQRTAGNIIPAYGALHGGEAATIEYAVSALKVKDIIVCGHSHCGAMSGLLNPELIEKMPAVKGYLEHAECTRRIVDENYGHLSDPEKRLILTVQENVLVQIENLKTHPSVAAAISRGELKLHGWVYKFETGEVFNFNPDEGQFLPLEEDVLSEKALDKAMPPIVPI